MDRFDEERRAFLEGRIRETLGSIPDAGEVDLQCELLRLFLDETFRFAADAEWQYVAGRDDQGRGDLVFASARNVESHGSHAPCKVLIMEVKFETPRPGHTARVANHNRRAYAAQQVQRSMQAWSLLHPNDDIWGAYFSNTTDEFFYAVSFLDSSIRLELRNPLNPFPADVGEAAVQVHPQPAEREEEGWGWGAWAAVGAAAVAMAGVAAYATNQRRRRDALP